MTNTNLKQVLPRPNSCSGLKILYENRIEVSHLLPIRLAQEKTKSDVFCYRHQHKNPVCSKSTNCNINTGAKMQAETLSSTSKRLKNVVKICRIFSCHVAPVRMHARRAMHWMLRQVSSGCQSVAEATAGLQRDFRSKYHSCCRGLFFWNPYRA